MPVSGVDAIQPAFRHALQQLTRPFRFPQWIRLGFVGFLAGELGSGGCNFNFNFPASRKGHGSEHLFGSAWPPHFPHHPALFAMAIALLVIISLAFTVLWTYVNSVMRFVLFDSVLTKDCRIRQGWRRRKPEGVRLFVWQLWLMLITFAVLLVFVGIPAAIAFGLGWLTHPREHLLPLILAGIAVFLLFFLLAVAALLVQVMTKDFVVPQMAFEDMSALEGWRRLLPCLKAEKGGYAGYVGMKIVLSIAFGIAVGIVTIIAILVLLIPLGGFAGIAFFAGKAAGLAWNAYTIAFAVVLGCIYVAVFIFVMLLISVPAIVFFSAYAIYFFASRYSYLAAALFPPAPVPQVPFSPPPFAPPTG